MISKSKLFKLSSAACIIALLSTAYAKSEPCFPYIPAPLDESTMVAPAKTLNPNPKTYILPATPATSQWGVFNSAQAPVLTINAGDTVVVETMAASDNQVVPGTTIQQVIDMKNAAPERGPHTVTGPIFINGAEPGDVLQIHFNKIVPRPYASNDSVPGKGLFPELTPNGQIKYFYLDVKNKSMQFAPGIVVPLAPFPGVIAVARAEPGIYDSIPPGRFGGNMDLREMVEGTTLYLPVFMKGALLWTGDSHAGQGNGEIDLTAIETAFEEFNITVDVIKQEQPLTWPRVETPTAWISVGYDKDLNTAFDIVREETIKLIIEKRHVSRVEAEKVMYSSWNCPIAEVVNGVQGIYYVLPKKPGTPAFPLPNADNAESFVTVAKDADLEQAMKKASMAMINKVSKTKSMTVVDAYVLASLTMDCRIATYYGSGDKEVHCMTAKNLWVNSK